MFKQSGVFVIEFTTASTTGAAADADALPVATLARNGVDTNVTLAVAKVDTGRYKITGTIPSDYADGDWIAVYVAATIGTIAAKNIAHNGVVASSSLDLDQLIGTDVVVGSVGEALAAARAQGVGKWVINTSAKTITLLYPDNTVFRVLPYTTTSRG